jgi:polyhydroxyalkanoate synthesis regulator protein
VGENYTIKKYSNRKYYDSHQHKYVSIGGVFQLFESLLDTDSPLKVIDRHNNDITTTTIIEGIKHHIVQNPDILSRVVESVLNVKRKKVANGGA